MKIDEIKIELWKYIQKNPKILQAAVLSSAIAINAHATTITKVRGEYPSLHSLIGHVVQGFDSKKVVPFGEVQFRKKAMKNYHQKFDFRLDPAEIIGTVLQDMYDEDKALKDKSISKLSIDLLLQKIIDDVNILSVSGVYNAAKIGTNSPEFGFSMDGINEIIKKLLLNAENPAFLIPGDAITQSNIVDIFTKYERNLPELVKPKVKKIFTSITDAEDYAIAYEDQFGKNTIYKDGAKLVTRLGKREIVGISGLTRGTIISTVDNGFVKMVDAIDNPATITSVQENGRILDVLGEFTLGYDFAINELTYVHTPDATKNKGLNNKELNEIYYPSENGLIA